MYAEEDRNQREKVCGSVRSDVGLDSWGANRLEEEGVNFSGMVVQCQCRVILGP